MTLILEADSPLLILTVRGMGMPSAIPATSLPSFVGLRSNAAPNPRLVASGHTIAHGQKEVRLCESMRWQSKGAIHCFALLTCSQYACQLSQCCLQGNTGASMEEQQRER